MCFSDELVVFGSGALNTEWLKPGFPKENWSCPVTHSGTNIA